MKILIKRSSLFDTVVIECYDCSQIGCHHLSSVFLGASMGHWCNTSHIGALQNVPWTVEQKMKYAIP